MKISTDKVQTKTFRIILAAVLTLLVLAFAGCRSGRGGIAEGSSAPGAAPVTSPQSALEAAAQSYPQWQDVEIPVKISLTKPTRFSASGKAVMVNGDAIEIKLRKLGLEVARIYFDNENIVVVSRPLRIAYKEEISILTHYTGLSLADLQCALLGRVFYPGRGALNSGNTNRFRISRADTSTDGGTDWTLEPVRASLPVTFTLSSSAADAVRLAAIAVDAADGIEMKMLQTVQTPYGPVPQTVDINASYGRHKLESAVKWSPDQAQWNTGVSLSCPEIPQGYRILDTPGLINMLRNL